jgi:hypothetical protein
MNHPKLDKKLTQVTRPVKGWIGFDLDGTLAEYDGWKGVDHIGAPIYKTLEFVKDLLAQGEQVKIMTARAGPQKNPQDRVYAIQAIRAWCVKHLGKELPITHEKDFAMVWLYDDRCTRVEKNTGVWMDPGHRGLNQKDWAHGHLGPPVPDQADPEPEKPEEYNTV